MPSNRTSSLQKTRRALAALVVLMTAARCGSSPNHSHQPTSEERRRAARIVRAEARESMHRFEDEDALRETLERLAEAQRLRTYRHTGGDVAVADEAQAEAPTAAAPAQAEGDGESITNNQVAGVDEGGIVKVHGEHLVVLRRGRLFTVRLGDTTLTPVAMVDAYPSGAAGGWYDEMLIHEDTIVVVGFNYSMGGTELGVFDIDDAGQIRRRGTHYLRSNDYYSSRNYASRLLGDRLVFYMPYGLMQTRWNGDEPEVSYTLPSIRTRGEGDDWNEVIAVSDIYRPIQRTANPALHTVVTCDLSRPELRCRAQGILGPWSRSFYVSRDAVYVWVGGERGGDEVEADRPDGAVYRLPFDGSAPGAVRVAGMPIDQFSFDQREDHLNVMVRSQGGGDWMWAPEVGSGDLALSRIPLSMFTDGVTTAPREAYRALPRVQGYALQNRFVHGHLLYGTGGGWGPAQQASNGHVIVHAVDNGATSVVPLPHGVDRLDVMGRDAVVIGSGGGGLHFSAIELSRAPRVAGHYLQPGASQGETRSHGFFYRPTGETTGVLGLPIRGSRGAGWHHLVEGSAGVLYLDVRNRAFTPLGVLGSSGARVNDRCQASCVDWYGNSRPIFYRGRVFALLGYELVEGDIAGGQIRELRRTHMYRDRAGAR